MKVAIQKRSITIEGYTSDLEVAQNRISNILRDVQEELRDHAIGEALSSQVSALRCLPLSPRSWNLSMTLVVTPAMQ